MIVCLDLLGDVRKVIKVLAILANAVNVPDLMLAHRLLGNKE